MMPETKKSQPTPSELLNTIAGKGSQRFSDARYLASYSNKGALNTLAHDSAYITEDDTYLFFLALATVYEKQWGIDAPGLDAIQEISDSQNNNSLSLLSDIDAAGRKKITNEQAQAMSLPPTDEINNMTALNLITKNTEQQYALRDVVLANGLTPSGAQTINSPLFQRLSKNIQARKNFCVPVQITSTTSLLDVVPQAHNVVDFWGYKGEEEDGTPRYSYTRMDPASFSEIEKQPLPENHTHLITTGLAARGVKITLADAHYQRLQNYQDGPLCTIFSAYYQFKFYLQTANPHVAETLPPFTMDVADQIRPALVSCYTEKSIEPLLKCIRENKIIPQSPDYSVNSNPTAFTQNSTATQTALFQKRKKTIIRFLQRRKQRWWVSIHKGKTTGILALWLLTAVIALLRLLTLKSALFIPNPLNIFAAITLFVAIISTCNCIRSWHREKTLMADNAASLESTQDQVELYSQVVSKTSLMSNYEFYTIFQTQLETPDYAQSLEQSPDPKKEQDRIIEKAGINP